MKLFDVRVCLCSLWRMRSWWSCEREQGECVVHFDFVDAVCVGSGVF